MMGMQVQIVVTGLIGMTEAATANQSRGFP